MNSRTTLAAVVLSIVALGAVGAAPGESANLLKDPAFATVNQPASPWTAQQHGDARITATSAGGVVTLTAPAKGTESWNTQFFQNGLPLKQGQRYTLTFTASGKLEGFLEVLAMQDVEPWAWFGDLQGYELTDTDRTFTYRFTSPIDTSDGRIAFQLGLATGEVKLKDVKLVAE